MTSPFAELLAKAVDDIDFVMGEVAEIRPRQGTPYGDRAADADREYISVKGSFGVVPAAKPMRGGGSDDFSKRPEYAAGMAEFALGANAVAGLTFEIKKGDLIRFPERKGCPQYAVTRSAPNHNGGLTLILAREDAIL